MDIDDKYKNIVRELSELETKAEAGSDSETKLMDLFVNTFSEFKLGSEAQNNCSNIDRETVEQQVNQINAKASEVFSKIIQGKDFVRFSAGDVCGKMLTSSEEESLRFLDSLLAIQSDINWEDVLTGASAFGYADVVEKIFLSKKVNVNACLDAVCQASNYGCINVLTVLIAYIPEEVFKESYIEEGALNAARSGQLKTLEFLLSDGRALKLAEREYILETTPLDIQHIDVIKFLLNLGPIDYNLKRQLIKENKNPAIQEILENAEIVEKVNEDGSFGLTMEDVRKHPIKYLRHICNRGSLPTKIVLLDSPSTVDVGGVSKQFHTELASGLASLIEGGDFPTLANPHTEKDQGSLLTQCATWYSLLYELNKDKSDKFLVGNLFCKEFFALVRIAASPDIKGEEIKEAAKVLKNKYPLLVKVILEPSLEANKEYADVMGLDSDEEVLKDASARIKEYLNAASYFYSGLQEPLLSEVKNGSFITAMNSLQGEAITIENLLHALDLDETYVSQIFGNQSEWIREKIQNSTPEWRLLFVKAITGGVTIAPNTKIHIRQGSRAGFEIHTCFNSIDLPVISNKEDFLIALETAITDVKYNIS